MLLEETAAVATRSEDVFAADSEEPETTLTQAMATMATMAGSLPPHGVGAGLIVSTGAVSMPILGSLVLRDDAPVR